MSGPHRLPPTAPARFGTAIDRSEPVGFRFGARHLSGFYGDTLASALLAGGVRSWAASPMRGRPRGLMALGLEDDAPLAVENDAGAFAAIPADEVLLREGMAARRVAPGARRALPLYELILERIRRTLPLPASKLPPVEPAMRGRRETCDVVVVGAGLAGLAAAAAVRAAGLDVRVIDASWRAGGAADLFDGTIDGRRFAAWAATQAGGLRDRQSLALSATAIGIDPDGTVTAVERTDPRRPGAVALRLVQGRAVVLATGFRERPLVFADNDRPGAITSLAARALLRRHAVAPGVRVVVATSCDDGYRTAIDLKEAGVEVAMVLDPRGEPEGPAVEMAKAVGVRVSFATVVTGVDYDERDGLKGVHAQNRFGEGASLGLRVIAADALVVSGGFTPRDELLRRSGLSEEQGLFPCFAGADAVASGWAAGLAAARHLGVTVEAAAPAVDAAVDDPEEPAAADLERLSLEAARGAFVDFGGDVTAADLSEAVAAGWTGPKALARRLGLALGRDGGRLSADLASRAFAKAEGAVALPPPAPGRATIGLLAARSRLKDG